MQFNKELLLKLAKAKRITVITGAGISAGSGMPLYRGTGGQWNVINPMEFASAQALLEHPEKVLTYLKHMREEAEKAEPNAAHRTLVEMESMYNLWIITQNVDNLHQRAGSRNIIELHGNLFNYKQSLNGIIRPDVLLFGQTLDDNIAAVAANAIGNADVVLSIGTSGAIPYVVAFAQMAKYLIDINPDETIISILSIHHVTEKAEVALPELWTAINKIKGM